VTDNGHKKEFGWCFIGAGSITHRVMKDMPFTKNSYPAAVWSRDYKNALKFAEQYDCKAYKDADEALRNPDVKAAYIATPHPFHKEFSLKALEKGIPVLCEKPISISYTDTREMIETARKNNVYLMEGMWTRHNPCVKKALEWIADGRIGKVVSMNVSFAFSTPYNPDSRLYNAESGGGALLDVGVYTISLAQFMFGEAPSNLSITALKAKNGVDCANAITLTYGDNAIARLFNAISVAEPDDAYIYGDNGYIFLPHFWAPKSVILKRKDDKETYAPGFSGEGFQFEFDTAADDILNKKKENSLLTHEHSLSVMRIIDEAQREL
jgi:predicted dehydrogenase